MHSLDLVPLVRALAASPGTWRSHVRFDVRSRTWSRLPAPSGVDVWLLTWLPDQGVDLHDHGDSAAGLTVVQGSLTEVLATHDGAVRRTVLRAGDAHGVEPGVVHDVVNRSTEPAVSIHAYWPPLERMTYWRRSGDRLLPVRTVVTDEPEVAA